MASKISAALLRPAKRAAPAWLQASRSSLVHRRSLHSTFALRGPSIVRMSERYVHPMQEIKVKEMMEGVEKDVRNWPGLTSIETLNDSTDPYRYVVVTKASCAAAFSPSRQAASAGQ